jgi:uncharacterized membrane protein
LVLDIKLGKELDNPKSQDLIYELLAVLPNILAFAMSFMLLAVFWSAHHSIFNYCKSINKRLLWMNMAYMLMITFIPFPTHMLALYPYDKVSVIFYCLCLGLTGFWHIILIYYIFHHKELLVREIKAEERKDIAVTTLIGPLLYFISIVLAFVYIQASYVIMVFVPVYHIFINKLHKHWQIRLLD